MSEIKKKKVKKVQNCQWIYQQDDCYYETGCEHAFQFNYERKEDSEFKYCPYCGFGITWREDGDCDK